MIPDEIDDKLPDFVTGRLPPGEAAIVRERLGEDDALRRRADEIARVYELPAEPVPPLRGGSPPLPRWSAAPARRTAAAVLVAAVALSAVALWRFLPRDGDGLAPPATPLPPTPFVAPALPMPPEWPESMITSYAEEADRLAARTGAPRVTLYHLPGCPRCEDVLSALKWPPVAHDLSDVVLHIVPVSPRDPEFPRALQGAASREAALLRLPAIVIESGAPPGDTIWEIQSARSLRNAIDDELAHLPEEAFVTPGRYDEARSALAAAAPLLDQERLGEAHEALAKVRRLAGRSAAGAAARKADEALGEHLATERERLASLIDAGGPDAARARALAARLAGELGAHPEAAAFRALAGR